MRGHELPESPGPVSNYSNFIFHDIIRRNHASCNRFATVRSVDSGAAMKTTPALTMSGVFATAYFVDQDYAFSAP
jgi:hypothetical protein